MPKETSKEVEVACTFCNFYETRILYGDFAMTGYCCPECNAEDGVFVVNIGGDTNG